MKIEYFDSIYDLYQIIHKNNLKTYIFRQFHYTKDSLTYSGGEQNSKYFVAFDNKNKPLGVAAIQVNPHNQEELWIKYVDVNKKYRRQRIGTELVRKIFEYANENNLYIQGSSRSEEGKQAMPSIIKQMKKEFPNVKYTPSPFNESIYFSFARCQPPTVGHQKVFNKLYETALKDRARHMVFISHSFDPIRNPIRPEKKIQFLEQLFPHMNFMPLEYKIINPYHAAKFLSEQGYKNAKLFVGDDRAEEFDKGIRNYIKHPNSEKSYNFENFEVVSVGSRLDEDWVSQSSGTKTRELALNGDFEQFSSFIPSNNFDIVEQIYYAIREGSQVTESELIRNYI